MLVADLVYFCDEMYMYIYMTEECRGQFFNKYQ